MTDAPRDATGSRRTGSKRGWWVALVFAVAAIVLGALLGVSLQNGGRFTPSPTPGEVSVMGVDRYVQYVGNTTGSIGPTVNDTCPWCPLAMSAGSWLELPIMVFSVQSAVPEIYVWSWLNGTVPHEFDQGHFMGLLNGQSYAAIYAILDPPLNATNAQSGPLLLSLLVTPCSYTPTAWDYCYPSS